MKNRRIKNTILAFTLAGMITIGGSPSQAALGDRTLSQGTNHPDVRELQQELRKGNYFTFRNNTSYYGSITRDAVKKFQKAHGLKADGIFGRASYAALRGNSSSNESSSLGLSHSGALRQGAKGSHVASLQRALKQLGHYKHNIDSSFGPATRAAVLSFQKASKIPVDGSAGPLTKKTINDSLGVKTSKAPSRGSSLNASKTIVMNASAYDLSYRSTGKRPGDRGYGITASGMKAGPGVVAVDPRVIPLGTKLYIESMDGTADYGHAVAGDTGGAIKGNKIDLFFHSSSAVRQFGRRNVRVKILK